MANQEKGNISLVWGSPLKNLMESMVTYDLGELGDTLSGADTIIHIQRNPNSIVTGVTVNLVKNTPGLNLILASIKARIPLPFTINDNGLGLKAFMASANATQIAIDDSSGGADAEGYSITFKGNLQIISMEG